MLIPNQTIETTCMPANQKHYQEKGYNCPKTRTKILVDIKDLMLSSHEKVNVICDYCGEIYQKQYSLYNRDKKQWNAKDCCAKCRPKKFAENFKANYGVDNPFQLKECQEKSALTNMQKYGYANAAQSEEIKQKIKETNIEKYGVSCPFYSSEIKAKIEKTNLERYGEKMCLIFPKCKKK